MLDTGETSLFTAETIIHADSRAKIVHCFKRIFSRCPSAFPVGNTRAAPKTTLVDRHNSGHCTLWPVRRVNEVYEQYRAKAFEIVFDPSTRKTLVLFRNRLSKIITTGSRVWRLEKTFVLRCLKSKRNAFFAPIVFVLKVVFLKTNH